MSGHDDDTVSAGTLEVTAEEFARAAADAAIRAQVERQKEIGEVTQYIGEASIRAQDDALPHSPSGISTETHVANHVAEPAVFHGSEAADLLVAIAAGVVAAKHWSSRDDQPVAADPTSRPEQDIVGAERAAAERLQQAEHFAAMPLAEKSETLKEFFATRDALRDPGPEAAGREVVPEEVQVWRTGLVSEVCREDATRIVAEENAAKLAQYDQRLADLNKESAPELRQHFDDNLRLAAPDRIEQRTTELRQTHFPEYSPPPPARAVEGPQGPGDGR